MQIAASFPTNIRRPVPEPASATIQRQTVQIPDTRAPDTTSKTVRSGNNVKNPVMLFFRFTITEEWQKHKTARSRSAAKSSPPLSYKSFYPSHPFCKSTQNQKQDDRKNQIFMQGRGMLRAVLKYTQKSFPKRHRGRYHFLAVADIAAGSEQNLTDQSPVHQYIGG